MSDLKKRKNRRNSGETNGTKRFGTEKSPEKRRKRSGVKNYGKENVRENDAALRLVARKNGGETGVVEKPTVEDGEKFKVIIVGGGYSGLVAAAKLIEKGIGNILVTDGQKRVGKKILVTGNGRGNVSNESVTIENYHGDGNFAGYAIKKYGVESVKAFYSALGLPLTSENGRLYPCSLQANALSDALRYATEKAVFLTGRKVVGVKKEKDGFETFTEDGKYYSEYVIFAFGGAAGQNLGTDGKSFALAESFGHSVTELAPSLVQMKTNVEFCRGLKGIKVDARVTLFDGESLLNPVKTVRGDLLFTDYGISGNTAFGLSAYLEKCASPYVVAEFLPDLCEEEISEAVETRRNLYPEKGAEALLCGLINNKIAEKIMRGIAAGKTVKELSDEDLKNAKKSVKRYIGRVTGTCGFDMAQVTHGGIRCGEVDEKTFESKICENLFIVGEALDVDGDCGGYNLQWAFSSACCAADGIARKINGKENNN